MDSELRHGDCLDEMKSLSSRSVDVVYVDPPFFTQKIHTLTTRDRKRTFEFSDTWESRQKYIEFLRLRIRECRRVLKDSGSLFFHCDTSASHNIRCMLDDEFGAEMFRAEIIWFYRRWSNSQRVPLSSHQTIYFYSKTHNYKYFQIYDDYSPSTNVDQILQRRKRDKYAKAVYARNPDGTAQMDGNKKGVPISDVWDIPFLNPKAKERVGYPTQKPVALLERIIRLTSESGDLVLDPFCGCGTTLVASLLQKRRCIGIDISSEALDLARNRISDPTRTFSRLVENGRESYLQSDEKSLAYLWGLPVLPVHRNRGIDAIIPTETGERPVLVRVQRNNESIIDAAMQLHRSGAKKQPAMLILLLTDPKYPDLIPSEIPDDVVTVMSTASQLKDRLEKEGIRILDGPTRAWDGT